MKIKFYDNEDKEYDSIEFFVNNINKNRDYANIISPIFPNESKEDMMNICKVLEKIFKNIGIENFLILPVNSKDEVPVIQKIKIEKEDK